MDYEKMRVKLNEYCESHKCDNCGLADHPDCCWDDDEDVTRDCFMKLVESSYIEGSELMKIAKPDEDEPNVDMVNHPPHYTQGGMECIDEMILVFGEEAVANFCLCNAWKYRKRAPFKGKPEEDMKKSDWYLDKYKKLKSGIKYYSVTGEV